MSDTNKEHPEGKNKNSGKYSKISEGLNPEPISKVASSSGFLAVSSADISFGSVTTLAKAAGRAILEAGVWA